jgi:predicted negative regulator of RcsB-dependent stress response
MDPKPDTARKSKRQFMKKTMIVFVLGAGLMAGLMVWANHMRHAPTSTEQPSTDAAAPQNVEPAQSAPVHHDQTATVAADSNMLPAHSTAATLPVPDPAADAKLAFKQSMDTLLSPASTHEQRQAAWKQLMDAGQLDQAVAQLQQLMAANPRSSQYPGDLGEAYLKECTLTKDVREQGILALNADELFDTSLNLDPSNWESRYTKAVALSYWPANMNKGQDVVDNLMNLIQQQQNLPPQTQYALPYLRLGDFYQKTGDTSSALNAWQQGAALFPANEDLKSRLASSN